MPRPTMMTDGFDETSRSELSQEKSWEAAPARVRRSPLPVVALAVACLIVAGIMLFGEGALWEVAGPGDGASVTDVSEGQEDGNAQSGGEADSHAGELPANEGTGYTDELLATYEVKPVVIKDEAWVANVRLAAHALNGTVIPAGDSLSFNEVVGERTAERGYQEAHVMSGNVTSTVVGGGVSQVSTALYVAALEAGLTVEERVANVVAVDYAEAGMDAWVSDDGKDLVIRNNTSYPVRIEATTSGSSASVSLFGVPTDRNVTRQVTSRVVDRYSRLASEVYDDPEAQGLLPSDSVRFYVAEVYVATYRDGQQESNVTVSRNTYQVVGEQAEGSYQS